MILARKPEPGPHQFTADEAKLLDEMSGPNLQVRAFGGYGKIPGDAWVAHDKAQKAYEAGIRSGKFWREPYPTLRPLLPAWHASKRPAGR
jgi:hypothetical protein